MTGTGTSTDPFIVSTWSELVTAAATSGVYITFPEGGGIIDMNKEHSSGISAVELNGVHISGNGWIIRNLHCDGITALRSKAGTTSYIDSLHFESFYIRNGSFLRVYTSGYGYDQYRIRFTGCRLGGVLYNSSLLYLDGSDSTFTEFSAALIMAGDSQLCSSPYGNPASLKHTLLDLSGEGAVNVQLSDSMIQGELLSGSISVAQSSDTSCLDIALGDSCNVSCSGTGMILLNSDKSGNAAVSGAFKYIMSGGTASAPLQLVRSSEEGKEGTIVTCSGADVAVEVTDEDLYTWCRLRVTSGEAYEAVTVYPMIRPAEVSDGTYKPYKPSLQKQIDDLTARLAVLEAAATEEV